MCEVFNRQLVDGRDKPIISALEYCREYLMKRLVIVQRVIDKSKGMLTPTATKILDKSKREASQLIIIWNGENLYQVTGPYGEQCCVDLLHKVCSCRRWELMGIPYKHAVAAIWYSAVNGSTIEEPESWVHSYYHVDTWRTMYSFKIKPLNGRSMWPKSGCPLKTIPPKHHRQIGRPKKSRRKTTDELSQPLVKGSKLRKIGMTVTCRSCNQFGHNSRSCKKKKGSS